MSEQSELKLFVSYSSSYIPDWTRLRSGKRSSPLLAFNTSYTRGESFMNRINSWE